MFFLLSGSDILSSSSCFHRIFWGSLLFFWFAFSPAFQVVAPLFFTLLYPLFPHSAFRASPCGLTQHFSACCGYGWVFPVFLCVFRLLRLQLSLPVSLRFSVCCDSGCSSQSSSPFSTSCASGCSFALALLMLSYGLQVLRLQFLGCPGAAFPALRLVFYRRDFTTD